MCGVKVFEGGKFDCLGDRGILKTSRHSMTYFTTLPTTFFTVNKFELLKSLSESSIATMTPHISPTTDETSLQEQTEHHELWLKYKKRLVQLTTGQRN